MFNYGCILKNFKCDIMNDLIKLFDDIISFLKEYEYYNLSSIILDIKSNYNTNKYDNEFILKNDIKKILYLIKNFESNLSLQKLKYELNELLESISIINILGG